MQVDDVKFIIRQRMNASKNRGGFHNRIGLGAVKQDIHIQAIDCFAMTLGEKMVFKELSSLLNDIESQEAYEAKNPKRRDDDD